MPQKSQKRNSKTGELKKIFSSRLLDWDLRSNRRAMPWKGEKDPYRVWLSEIILQQTRVDQGLGYYNRFLKAFPNIETLAKAGDHQVLKLWEGLGYYSRCRNLLATARTIYEKHGGKFPASYEELIQFKGIGPYTGAAIASFAFDLPYAVVDGNVYRVISRIFGVKTSIDTVEGKKYFKDLSQELLDKKSPGIFNQAIMDFGAIICKPKPDCVSCPFLDLCIAFKTKRTNQYPVKEKKKASRKRWFNYLVVTHRGRIAIQQRNGKDIWQQLYEFPMFETTTAQRPSVILKRYKKMGWITSEGHGRISFHEQSQQLSHQLIHASFTGISLSARPAGNEWKWIQPSSLKQFSFPRLLRTYIDNSLKLN